MANEFRKGFIGENSSISGKDSMLLVAIMLGRPRMTIDQCENESLGLS